LVLLVVVWHSPATIDRPGSVLRWTSTTFSRQPELLAVFGGFGIVGLIFVLFTD